MVAKLKTELKKPEMPATLKDKAIMPFIEVQNVWKKFEDVFVLKNLNLSMKEGEVLGILGESGAGKSVFMHMLRGMDTYAPTQGKIIYKISLCPNCYWVDLPSKKDFHCPICETKLVFKSVDFWNESDRLREAIKSRIAIMFQRTFALYGYLSPLENIVEALKKAKCPDEEILKKAIEYVEKVNLTHRVLHPAETLSGGEKQRVVLARQLAINPILFLADEPTGTIDPENTEIICKLLADEIKRGSKTMVITSHLPEIVSMFADKVVWLSKGEVVEVGSVEDVVTKFLGLVPSVTVETKVFEEKILKASNIKKYYYSIDRGLVKAVDDVSFYAKRQEILGIVGPSGTGKTTLAKIISGYLEPSEGDLDIKIGNAWVNLYNLPAVGLTRLDYIGFLHQEYSLYPHRTTIDNLTDAIGLGLPTELGVMKSIHVLRGVGFDEEEAKNVLEKYPDELSEGGRHRIGLAQVLIREPRIVVLDEPTGTMDPVTKVEVANSIKRSRIELEETFIIVSHDLDFVDLTCDRALSMKDGKMAGIYKGKA